MERDVLALFVLVADDIMRAGDDAASTASTQTSGDDLLVEFFPLVCPTFGFYGCGLSNSHGF